ncbi:MAG: outer membrane protein assembly factor BamD [Gammaproteobacteria bacterium]|nr:outer membrane protein assembly factor BamD [Gammaproteobacteria bacterium]MDH5799494.1 outer membrane protein assembly factor BamD [Gammaproteobacteria bacterium]
MSIGCGYEPEYTESDSLLYQQALANYQADNYEPAKTQFLALIDQYPQSIYIDNANYYIARCYHELQDFATARNLYTAYPGLFPASVYVDNAVFYHAKSFYDEAKLQIQPQAEFDLLQNAANGFLDYITTFSLESLLDDAQYYLGRSLHTQAEMLQTNPSLSITLASDLFINARHYYDTLIADPLSVYNDNAQYFKGQSFHEEGLYADARLEYIKLVTTGTSNWSDDAQYQIGKTFYDEASSTADANTATSLYDSAIVEFTALITSINPIFNNSNRLDSAYYFEGRSLQQQAELITAGNVNGDFTSKYVQARTAFQELVSRFPLSIWADNALYQSGSSYYDEATLAQNNQDFAVMKDRISLAVLQFSTLLSNTVYSRSNSADNARYYLGKSYQMIYSLPTVERSGIYNNLDLAQVTLDWARDTFITLAQDFPQSNWVDNAYYEIGTIYQLEAPTAIDPVAGFNQALHYYNLVVRNYAGSIREDNAVYNMGEIYHYTGYCAAEKATLDYALTLPTLSQTLADDINTNHFAELTTALATAPPTPNGSHLCDNTNFAGIDTTYF